MNTFKKQTFDQTEFSTLHHLQHDSRFHTNTNFSTPLHETTLYADNNTVKIYLVRKKTLTQGIVIVGHFPQTPRKYHAKDSPMTVVLLRCVSSLLSTLHKVDWVFKRQGSLFETVT